jgi:hypothetical protein
VAIPAHYFGVWVVMALPLLGTLAVFVLTVTLWVEARLNG